MGRQESYQGNKSIQIQQLARQGIHPGTKIISHKGGIDMNPNSICALENEILRARLKRNKELARDILVMIQSPSLMDRGLIQEKLNEIIKGE